MRVEMSIFVSAVGRMMILDECVGKTNGGVGDKSCPFLAIIFMCDEVG